MDVSKDAYYAPCVNWAVKNGIVSGIDAKHFAPEKLITREQAAVMLSNYLSYAKITLPTDNSKPLFADNASISNYAVDAVRLMQEAGLMVGTGNNYFRPRATSTRAQIATLMYSFYTKVA